MSIALTLERYLDTKLQRRVMPEVFKAFQTKVSRREDYRIACYDVDITISASDGGLQLSVLIERQTKVTPTIMQIRGNHPAFRGRFEVYEHGQ